MINNSEDLLPLGSAGLQSSLYRSGPVPSAHETPEDFGDFSARVAETFDSVDLLIAARAEAEEAEARAKAAGETPLPFAKNGKSAPAAMAYAEPAASWTLCFRNYSIGGTVTNYESPAMQNIRRTEWAAVISRRSAMRRAFKQPVRPRFHGRRTGRGGLR